MDDSPSRTADFSPEHSLAESVADWPYGSDAKSLWRDYARHLAPGKVRIYEQLGLPTVMGLRGGSTFGSTDGLRRWINCHCNGGVFNLGHRNPRVVAALRRALDQLDIGNHHLVSPWRAQLARRLVETTGERLPGVVFGVSGGEAMDLAIKVCRGYGGRPRILSAHGGYHGHTGLAMAAGDKAYREPFGIQLPGFEQVPFDDLPALDRALDDSVAAVVLEPVPATLGMPICSDDYLPGVERLCRERGAAFIVDEVQTGLGRTGRCWAYEHWGLSPDVVVTGKGLSGGIYPIAATLMTAELHAIFEQHPFAHISTFGGAELGCATALEVLDILGAPGFLERVTAISDHLAERLASLPFELRRKGLMMGLAFPHREGGVEATRRLYEQGIFAVWAGNDPSVVQFLPPLVITDEEIEDVVEVFHRLWRR